MMARVVDELKLEGVSVKDEDLARIWPTRFGHLNVIGRYHFEVEQERIYRILTARNFSNP